MEKPEPHIVKTSEGTWLIEVAFDNSYGMLELFPDGDIIAIVRKDKVSRAVSTEQEDTGGSIFAALNELKKED